MNSNVTTGKIVLNNGHSVYEGEILDGKATGKGLLRWDDGENWEGAFINGVPNGHCRRFWNDGMYVEGIFKNGQPVGDVKLFQPGVGLFEGAFDGNGAGKMTYPDGSLYEGEFADRQPNGWGRKVLPGMYDREGEWRNGEPYGYSVNKVSDAFAAQVGAKAGWTGEGITTQGAQRDWWIRTANNVKPELLRASDESFDIPQEDMPLLSLNARLFLGFVEMYHSVKDEAFQLETKSNECDLLKNQLAFLLTQPIKVKGDVYYNWLCERMQTAESAEDYAVLADKFGKISEYKDCAALAAECNRKGGAL